MSGDTDAHLKELRVLVVEDSEDDAVLLLRQLQKEKFQVAHVRVQTGPDMEAALDRGGWDIVISDHYMPAFDSLSALNMVKAKGLDIPFIVVSGAIGEEAAVELLRAGAADFIKKGNWARLVPAVRRELREARHRRERARARQAEIEAEARYTALFENAVEGIFQSTPEGRFLSANPATARILGYQSPEELTDSVTNIQEEFYVKPHRRDEFLRQLEIKGEVSSFEVEVFRKDRSTIWVSLHSRAAFNPDGSMAHLDSILEDITARKRAEDMLYQNAFYDQLTGLPNRALFTDRLHRTMERIKRRPGLKFSVLFLDLDQFKTINDSLGHQAGDELLLSVAQMLKECVREEDTVARFGGDEFVVLLDELTDFKLALAVTRRILRELQAPRLIQSREVYTSTSVGIVLSSQPFDTAETVLRCADIAMYQAKRAGRNRFKVYNHRMGRQAEWRLEMETSLRQAINERQFLVHYQPIVSMENGRIRGVEALVRWERPGKGLVPPAQFIPLAEETGLIDLIGHEVMVTACRQARVWQRDSGRPDLFMAVNISGRQFQRNGFVEEVQAVIRETGIDPGLLKLEITESMLMENPHRMVGILERLKGLGVALAMDDFGTGYSSLSYLNQFPLDVIKIDRSFIKRMSQGRRDSKLVRTIVSLGRGMDMDVVAEGVEDEVQAETLMAMGCRLAQGNYYSMARPADEVTRLIGEDAIREGNGEPG